MLSALDHTAAKGSAFGWRCTVLVFSLSVVASDSRKISGAQNCGKPGKTNKLGSWETNAASY